MGTLKTNEEIKKEISEAMEELSWVVEGGDAHDLQDTCDKAHACLADTLSLIARLESDATFYKNISLLNAKTCDMQNELIEEIKTDRARLAENIMWMEAERDDLKRYNRQLEAERDAVMQDMTKNCASCKYAGCNNPGSDGCPYVEQCQNYRKWQWRGLQQGECDV